MRKVFQMRNLCKQLFPSDNIGQTMVRVLELLTENSQLEVYHKDLVQVNGMLVIGVSFMGVKWRVRY